MPFKEKRARFLAKQARKLKVADRFTTNSNSYLKSPVSNFVNRYASSVLEVLFISSLHLPSPLATFTVHSKLSNKSESLALVAHVKLRFLNSQFTAILKSTGLKLQRIQFVYAKINFAQPILQFFSKKYKKTNETKMHAH